MVVPVIINQNQPQTIQQQQNGGSFNLDQLRDMIQQAVSTQLQLHGMKNDSNLRQSMATLRSVDSGRTTNTMREEEAKLRCES